MPGVDKNDEPQSQPFLPPPVNAATQQHSKQARSLADAEGLRRWWTWAFQLSIISVVVALLARSWEIGLGWCRELRSDVLKRW